VTELREAAIALLEDRKRLETMSLNCRRIVLEEYGRTLLAEKYLELYQTMIHAMSEGT